MAPPTAVAKPAEEIMEKTPKMSKEPQPSLLKLLTCVGGIYASFLAWAVLQERISTTPYGPDGRVFRASILINTVQAALASLTGFVYLTVKRRGGASKYQAAVFPTTKRVQDLALVAICQSVSSYFAYSSLAYVDYLTLLLAKSCKLVPVMLIHTVLYRRTYPMYKYMVVAAITLGVSLFTVLGHGGTKKASSETTYLGIAYLITNLLLDGFYNTTQDNMFYTSKDLTGAHMMCGLNAATAVLSALFLASGFTSELRDAAAFISAHPAVLKDVFLFGACGALGQIFIFQTLEAYGSLTLVAVTVTRKMISIVLSVVMFNHRLSHGQYFGAVLVFGGIAVEAAYKIMHDRAAKRKTA